MESANKTVWNKKQEKVVNLAFPEGIFRPSCGAFALEWEQRLLHLLQLYWSTYKRFIVLLIFW